MSRTSNPTRAPRRRSQPQAWKPTRDRKEIAITVAAVVAIVLATALAIWLLRPSSTVQTNDAGILARQARIAWFLLLLVAIAAVVYSVLRHFFSRIPWVTTLAIAIIITAVIGAVAGRFWPGGLVNPGVVEATPPVGQPADPGPLPSGPEPFPSAPTTTAAPTETTAPTG